MTIVSGNTEQSDKGAILEVPESDKIEYMVMSGTIYGALLSMEGSIQTDFTHDTPRTYESEIAIPFDLEQSNEDIWLEAGNNKITAEYKHNNFLVTAYNGDFILIRTARGRLQDAYTQMQDSINDIVMDKPIEPSACKIWSWK